MRLIVSATSVWEFAVPSSSALGFTMMRLQGTPAASELPPDLATARLRLRPLRLDDAQDFFAYAGDPEVARTTSWETHHTLEESQVFIERALRGYERGERTLWAIEHLQSGRMVGTVGLHDVNALHARATLAYALARSMWGQGYATEAARRVTAYGFELLNLNRIEAFCLPRNQSSRRVMEKLGMRYEGTLRERIWLKGAFRDLAYYAVLKSEWVSGRTAGQSH